MISRTLGPEFGGALGVLLFISQVLSSGTYITSMTEAIVDSFGNESGTLEKFLPESYSFQLLYRFEQVIIVLGYWVLRICLSVSLVWIISEISPN